MPRARPNEVPARRKAFGQRLRELRTRAGLSQTAMASASGMDRTFYADVERARYSVSIDNVFAIADALNVSDASLFTGPEQDEAQ